MKKIFIILCCLLLSGCYNYIELDELAVVTMIAIDYKDDDYIITLEIRENIKDEDNKSLIYKGKGKSLDSAIQNTSFGMNKILYFVDLEMLVLSQDAINNKLDSIIDYLTRDNNVGVNFKTLVDDNIDETILNIKEKDKIVGQYIKQMIESYFNNIVNVKYYDFLESYLSDMKDLILPYGVIQDGAYIINQAVIFNGNKIVGKLDFNKSNIYNLLNKTEALYLFNNEYHNHQVVFKAFDYKVKFDYKNNKIFIKLNINGNLDEIESIDLKNEKNVQNLIKIIKLNIKDDCDEFVRLIKEKDADVLGFKKVIYNKTKKKIESIKDLNYDIDVNVTLDRKGLIFESIGDVHEKNK